MADKISDAALDTLFRKARSYGSFAEMAKADKSVTHGSPLKIAFCSRRK